MRLELSFIINHGCIQHLNSLILRLICSNTKHHSTVTSEPPYTPQMMLFYSEIYITIRTLYDIFSQNYCCHLSLLTIIKYKEKWNHTLNKCFWVLNPYMSFFDSITNKGFFHKLFYLNIYRTYFFRNSKLFQDWKFHAIEWLIILSFTLYAVKR